MAEVNVRVSDSGRLFPDAVVIKVDEQEIIAGQDGISPVVTVTEIGTAEAVSSHGYEVDVSDAAGVHTYSVYDGASAYAQAVAGGYSGTEEEFAADLIGFNTRAAEATAAATAAAAYADAASGSATAAATSESNAAGSATAAASSASEAASSAGTATTAAGSASSSATAAAESATSASNKASEAASSESNAASSATAASASATAAAASETAAASSASSAASSATAAAASATAIEEYEHDAEAWAIGKRGGTDVDSSDATYQNNSKYYAEQAAASSSAASSAASEASQSATDAASEAASSKSYSRSSYISSTMASGSATAAAEAQTAAETAASTAEGHATNAASSATAASGSATAAAQSATEAGNASTAATTAQEAAEDAQEAAETAAQSVSQSAAQIATNTSDIGELKSATSELTRAIYVSDQNLFQLYGRTHRENLQVKGQSGVFIRLFSFKIKAGILYTYTIQLSESPAQSVYFYCLDENNNYIESNGSIGNINNTDIRTVTKTYTNDYDEAYFAIKTVSGCSIKEASVNNNNNIINSTKPILGHAANMLLNPAVADLDGAFYGPVSNFYTAKTASENWQQNSYVYIRDIPVGTYKYVYAIISERHGLGLRAGYIQWYDSTDSGATPTGNVSLSTEKYDNAPIIQKIQIPEGTVKFSIQFEGITNASTAGTPSVIGETYYVRDCYAYVTNTPIDDFEEEYSLNSEWLQAIDSIRQNQGAGLCFGIQTDTHFALTHPDSVGKQMNTMTKYVGFDFVANLGDITRGYNGANYPDSPENMRLYAKEIMNRYTAGIQCPFFVAIGNHERNSLYVNAHPGTEVFSMAELYAQYTKQSINTSAKIAAEPGKSYYYADLVPARVIVLFTNDNANGNFTVSADQVSWFTNKALDTDKPVLVLCHAPLVNGWSIATNYSSDFAKIITPLEAFKNNGGTVIACVYGHGHKQESQKVNDIWHIMCTKTENQFTTAEFFMVDPTTFDITTIGVGAAQSRTFTH